MERVIVTGVLVIGAVLAGLIVVLTVIPFADRDSQSVAEQRTTAFDALRTSIEIVAINEQ